MEKALKQQFLLVFAGVSLFVGLTHLNVIGRFLQNAAALLLPVILGLGMAFILNVPMYGFQKRLTRWYSRRNRPVPEDQVVLFSFFLTIGCLLLILVLVFTLVLPQLGRSIQSLYDAVQRQAPVWIRWLKSYDINTEQLTQRLETLDWSNLLNRLTIGAGTLLNSVAGAASSAVSGTVTFGISMVIAIYTLLEKKMLCRQSKKILYACLRPKTADWICRVGEMLRGTFAKFLSGQCMDALILGLLIFITFSLFGMPYAGLIGILTGMLAFVPYAGAFTACALGALLMMVADPSKVMLSIIVFQIVQFIENQFIYPRVVGSSVGLSPLWTLLAAVVGGKLLGLFGMIFFIPLFAVLYQLIRESVHKRLSQKKICIK